MTRFYFTSFYFILTYLEQNSNLFRVKLSSKALTKHDSMKEEYQAHFLPMTYDIEKYPGYPVCQTLLLRHTACDTSSRTYIRIMF